MALVCVNLAKTNQHTWFANPICALDTFKHLYKDYCDICFITGVLLVCGWSLTCVYNIFRCEDFYFYKILQNRQTVTPASKDITVYLEGRCQCSAGKVMLSVHAAWLSASCRNENPHEETHSAGS